MVRLLTISLLASAALAARPAAAADAGTGKTVFASQCGVCHSNSKGGPVILGPPLFGVIGRKAGSVPGFDYSATMRNAGFVWTPDRLRSYLPGPRDYLPGVRMTYAGLHDPQKLEDLIAYLKTLK